jgi:DNA-binding MarR family transcriptional regulator
VVVVSNDDLEQLGSELVMYAARLVRAVRRAVSQPAGVRVLSILDEQGPLGITSLAEADRCSQPTMSGTVNALAERGWVRRVPNPADARGTLVELTDEGAAALASFRRDNGRAVAARLRDRHSSPDLARAVALLRDALGDATPESTHETGVPAPEEGPQ